MAISSKPPPRDDLDVVYPDSDGEPMGETDWHIAAIILLRQALHDHFAPVPDVYVASDMFLYYEQGNPRACKAPDTMVIKGVAKHYRHSFKTWVEKAVPCVVFEITSEKTIKEDLTEKRDLYARLGVAEYFLFDPEALVLDPPLEGFRLKGKKYVEIKPAADGTLTSQVLGLRLKPERHMLRLIDAATGEPVLTKDERAEQAAERAEQEKKRAEQEKQRAEQEKQRARQERQRAEQESQEAKKERQRAEELAAEVARLQAELARARGKKKGPS